jgi:PTS system ascorbate-specific IIA component
MSVGLLLITHNGIGDAMLQTAINMLGNCPLQAEAIAFTTDDDPDQIQQQASKLATELDSGDGVLVLTDLYGSTPGNIASSLQEDGKVNVLSGINLPMVIKVLNYPYMNLAEITAKAHTGAQEYIIECKHPDRCVD